MDRYSRQVLVAGIGRSGQEKLLKSKVLIIGCGALGTVIANNLVRAGVGYMKVVDRDFVELDNLQRQMLFDEADVEKRMPKAIAAVDKLRKINSSVKIEAEVKDVTQKNIEELIKDVDIVLDATDNLEIRLLINDTCFKHNIPWISGSVDTCDTIGVLNATTSIIASLQSNEALKMLLGDEDLNQELLVINLKDNSFYKIVVKKRDNCPLCGDGVLEFLDKKGPSEPIKLCGREMIQITPQRKMKASLEHLKRKLERVGEASYLGYLLRFRVEQYELTIFPDGRAFVKGVSDKETARSLYAKYIGV